MNRFRMRSAAIHDLVAPVLPPSMQDGATEEVEHAMLAAAAWSLIQEPGDQDAGVVREMLGHERSLELLVDGASAAAWLREAGEGAAELAPRISAALARWRPRVDDTKVRRALEQGVAWHQRLVTRDAREWPTQVDDLGPHAPAALWVRGDVDLLQRAQRSIALVGARASSGYGEHVAMLAVEELVRHELTTVSGAAYGIDGCVHRATLATGGVTIAVMAGGLDRLYPLGNEGMLLDVERSGLLVAELPSGATPSRHRFLLRNRIIAALASATVVVEASARSGSINTAGHAATLGRPLGAVPGSVVSGTSAGCHMLIRDYGAQLVQSAAEMRELVDGIEVPTLDARRAPDETRVLDALTSRSGRDEREIATRSGMSIDDVRATIGLLELTGAVAERGRGWVRV